MNFLSWIKNSHVHYALGISIYFLLGGCDELTAKVLQNEVVLCDDVSVGVIRNGERLEIRANGLVHRIYKVGNVDVSVDLSARWQRWFGSFGLYRPSGVGDLHMVIEEGIQHFYSEEEMFEWLNERGDRLKYIYTSDGLVLGWSLQENPGSQGPPRALIVDLWQLLVKEKRPSQLPGASDELFRFSGNRLKCLNSKNEYVASAPKTIDGRLYSGRAIDFMNERKVPLGDVEKAIKNWRESRSDGVVTYYPKGSFNRDPKSISWVKLDEKGRVVSIG